MIIQAGHVAIAFQTASARDYLEIQDWLRHGDLNEAHEWQAIHAEDSARARRYLFLVLGVDPD